MKKQRDKVKSRSARKRRAMQQDRRDEETDESKTDRRATRKRTRQPYRRDEESEERKTDEESILVESISQIQRHTHAREDEA